MKPDNKSAVIRSDKINKIIVATARGKSGKYSYLLCHHYDGKQTCWDVAAFNHWTGEIVARHHHTKEEALVTWEQILAELKRIAELPEEKDEPNGGLLLIDPHRRVTKYDLN